MIVNAKEVVFMYLREFHFFKKKKKTIKNRDFL